MTGIGFTPKNCVEKLPEKSNKVVIANFVTDYTQKNESIFSNKKYLGIAEQHGIEKAPLPYTIENQNKIEFMKAAEKYYNEYNTGYNLYEVK